ncbi:MAG TPA: glycosyltransferase family 39 protein [Candidatus Hydrogenedentes bacterium]|nr:glycosyltransferase family 39 protein [Candidatus Hydrogenedentota bacterium]
MPRGKFLGVRAVLLYLALFNLLLHLITYRQYGYFIDEFHNIDMGKHLAWGYVDNPCLIALIACGVRVVLGNSLFAVRLLPAICGALVVWLTGRMALRLGGGLFAVALAALAVIAAPIYQILCGIFTVNVFDVLFWNLCVYTLIVIFKTGRQRLWLVFGLLAGLGLENKISVLYLGFGLFIGLLLTRQRQCLAGPWPWAGALVALLIFSPYVFWQLRHDWPTLEFIRNTRAVRHLRHPPHMFMLAQVLLLNPASLPVWLAGLDYCLRDKDGKDLRTLGWSYLVTCMVLIVLHGKIYYLAPTYPILFAAGAVAIEKAAGRSRDLAWLRPAAVALVLAGGIAFLPYGVAVLSPAAFIRYSDALKLHRIVPVHRGDTIALPVHYANMFGWDKLVESVAETYAELTPEERPDCILLAGSYGTAGAINHLGGKYGLPEAVGGHNNYYFWGPGDRSGKVAISVGIPKSVLDELFAETEQVAVIQDEYLMVNVAGAPVYVSRKPKISLKDGWERLRRFD